MRQFLAFVVGVTLAVAVSAAPKITAPEETGDSLRAKLGPIDAATLDGQDSTAFWTPATFTKTGAETISGAWDFTSHTLKLSPHLYRSTYDGADGNVYDHYYPSGFGSVSKAHLRVWDGGGAAKELYFDGTGTFQWNGQNVWHAGNITPASRAGDTFTGQVVAPKIGIGRASLGATLDVQGSAETDTTFANFGYDGTNSSRVKLHSIGWDGALSLYNGTNTEQVRLHAGDATSPSFLKGTLHLGEANAAALQLDVVASDSQWGNTNDPTVGGIARFSNGGRLALRVGADGYNRTWIQSIQDDGSNNVKPLNLQPNGGSVAIGVSGNPGAAALTVNGDIDMMGGALYRGGHGIHLAQNGGGWGQTVLLETGWDGTDGDFAKLRPPGAGGNTSALKLSSGGPLRLGAVANPAMTFDSTASGSLWVGQFTNGAYIGPTSADATAGRLRLGAGNVEWAFLTPAGNFGVGAHEPSAPLTGVKGGEDSNLLVLGVEGTSGNYALNRARVVAGVEDWAGFLNLYNAGDSPQLKLNGNGSIWAGGTIDAANITGAKVYGPNTDYLGWTQWDTYSWTAETGTLHYWARLFQLQSEGMVTFDVLARSDVNYHHAASYRVNASRFQDSHVSMVVSKLGGSTSDRVALTVAIDANGYVWARVPAEWNSFVGYKITNVRGGVAVLSTPVERSVNLPTAPYYIASPGDAVRLAFPAMTATHYDQHDWKVDSSGNMTSPRSVTVQNNLAATSDRDSAVKMHAALNLPWDGRVAEGVSEGYLLLAKAHVGGNADLSEVEGKIFLSRGGTGTGNRTSVFDVHSKRAYTAEYLLVTNRVQNDGYVVKTVKVQYAGTTYHAVKMPATGGSPHAAVMFTGLARDSGLGFGIVSAQDCLNEVDYGSTGLSVNPADGRVDTGGDLFVNGWGVRASGGSGAFYGAYVTSDGAANQPLSLIGNLAGNSTNTDVIVRGAANRSAGYIFAVVNEGQGTRFRVDHAGNGEFPVAGSGVFLKSPNGTRYKLTVSDAGALSVVAAP